jgi:hypothetical protein
MRRRHSVRADGVHRSDIGDLIMPRIRVLKPIWHQGKRIEVGAEIEIDDLATCLQIINSDRAEPVHREKFRKSEVLFLSTPPVMDHKPPPAMAAELDHWLYRHIK